MTETTKHNGYSFDDDLMPIIRGEVVLPNFEEMPLSQAVNHAAALGNVHAARIQFAGASKHNRPRAIIALEMNQFRSRLLGTGIVLFEGGYPHGGQGGRFAICKHEFQSDPGADPRRGWHPGRCTKCGLDMTVDSGD